MSNSKPKVSVIVPIYGVEAYIERCAVSLFEQTLDDIEYIFVNDCTPDNSMTILSEVLSRYPQRREQVRIINQPKNLGAAKAREDGIKAARGEYIIHCDSDDWVEKNMYQLLYEKAKADNSDMVICDLVVTDGVNHEIRTQDVNVDSDLLSGIINLSISGSLCNKLVDCNIYQSLNFFPTEHMIEDVAYNVQLVHKCKKIGYLKCPLYYYYIRNNSICHEGGEFALEKKWIQAVANTKFACKYAKNNGFYKEYEKDFLTLKFNIRGFLMPLMKQNNRYWKEWIYCFPELNWKFLGLKSKPLSIKVIFLITMMGLYPLFSKLRKLS